jgi:hypothetical protein
MFFSLQYPGSFTVKKASQSPLLCTNKTMLSSEAFVFSFLFLSSRPEDFLGCCDYIVNYLKAPVHKASCRNARALTHSL